jgi:hypothetical protein
MFAWLVAAAMALGSCSISSPQGAAATPVESAPVPTLETYTNESATVVDAVLASNAVLRAENERLRSIQRRVAVRLLMYDLTGTAPAPRMVDTGGTMEPCANIQTDFDWIYSECQRRGKLIEQIHGELSAVTGTAASRDACATGAGVPARPDAGATKAGGE